MNPGIAKIIWPPQGLCSIKYKECYNNEYNGLIDLYCLFLNVNQYINFKFGYNLVEVE
jgi:hypothetical protein